MQAKFFKTFIFAKISFVSQMQKILHKQKFPALIVKTLKPGGLKARFEYEFEIPQMSFKELCGPFCLI